MSPPLRAGYGPSKSLYLSLGEWPRLPFTARIERAPFHRARSASKKGTWPLPPLLADFFSILLEEFQKVSARTALEGVPREATGRGALGHLSPVLGGP